MAGQAAGGANLERMSISLTSLVVEQLAWTCASVPSSVGWCVNHSVERAAVHKGGRLMHAGRNKCIDTQNES